VQDFCPSTTEYISLLMLVARPFSLAYNAMSYEQTEEQDPPAR
jgi:hypothetical protein